MMLTRVGVIWKQNSISLHGAIWGVAISLTTWHNVRNVFSLNLESTTEIILKSISYQGGLFSNYLRQNGTLNSWRREISEKN